MTGQRRTPAGGNYDYVPDSVLPPGATLRETLAALNMSQAELSLRTGLSTKHINQIVQGVAVLSHDTAIALERATGVPARMWNSLEANYRDYIARSRERDDLADQSPSTAGHRPAWSAECQEAPGQAQVPPPEWR